MSGLRPDLAFTQREADNPDAVSDNSDERGVGRSEKSFPNRRPAFRAGRDVLLAVRLDGANPPGE